MEGIRADNVAAVIKSAATYGGHLAAVFHNYSLIAERIPSGFEGAINILDATVATLKQILAPLNDEAAASGKKLFSEEGLKYVHLLALESAITLSKVESAIEEACLDRQERKALLKQKKKPSYKTSVTVPDPLSLKLDEKKFLEKVETTKWSWAIDDIEKCMERLYDLQLHVLLVFQVVTVSALSRDVSSGNVDIKSIVTCHERINRTADLVGIKAPSRRTINLKRCSSFSSSDTLDTETDSDVPETTIKGLRRGSPPPPPPPPPGIRGTPHHPAFQRPSNLGNGITSVEPLCLEVQRPKDPIVIIDIANPPAYSETNKSASNGETSSSSNSTLLGTVPPASSVISPSSIEESSSGHIFAQEKAPAQKEESTECKKDLEMPAPEPRLFKSKSTGLGFKFKSFFRTKESLAEEMRQTLNDTETALTAFVIQKGLARMVPHSAFHSLEATHMKTVLSQLNDNSWYKTFSTLETSEHHTLARLLQPWVHGKMHKRELVVLKVVQQNRLNAWMVLLSELLRNQPHPRGGSGRVILAICRERLVDGKPLPSFSGVGFGGPPPPPPPPPTFPPAPTIRNIRHPPLPYTLGRTTKISDLSTPPPPPPPANWFPRYMQAPPPPGATSKKSSVRVSDTTPVTDNEAKEVLTSYNEYTVRICEPTVPSDIRSWQRVVVTQESAERYLVQQRVEQFEARDGNVIETKLRMTQHQSEQVTRIMDEIKSSERDTRFEWCWAEISLHNDNGEITDFVPRGSNNILATATIIHLIAKRSLKLQYKAMDVYNALIKLGPSPLLRGVHGGPPPISSPPGPTPVITLAPEPKKTTRGITHISDSESDSDSTTWDSDSSVGNVRRHLRKYRAKKRRSVARKKCYSDTDSDSEAEEEDDIIKVHVILKRGDDIVNKLLELWTAEPELKNGKGKGKMT